MKDVTKTRDGETDVILITSRIGSEVGISKTSVGGVKEAGDVPITFPIYPGTYFNGICNPFEDIAGYVRIVKAIRPQPFSHFLSQIMNLRFYTNLFQASNL